MVAIALSVASSFAQERATAAGKIVDASGAAVDHATVLVYEAGVKKGYSQFCPTCYTDCGKRSITDAEGRFTIAGLSPDLLFTLLVVKDGYSAEYIRKLDPAKGPAANTVLKPRSAIEDAAQAVKGRVVDRDGAPVRDVIVEQKGVTAQGPGGGMMTGFGASGWIDQAVVSNDKGEFEIAYGKPAVQMILNVAARGMAPKLVTLPTGPERKTVTVTDGALIRGRLLFDGKPMADAQLGLITHERRSGTMYPEVTIGTREDGTFAITNVPAGRIWLLYPKMDSLAARGIGGDIVPVETKDDGQEVDVGDIELKRAFTFKGRVVLTDGKPIPPDMRVTLGADRAWDSQIAILGPDGRFEFRGVPAGIYSVGPAVKGYRTVESSGVEALVKKDVSDFVIRMEPAPPRP